MFSCEYCEVFKNNFFYRWPPVAAFGYSDSVIHWQFSFCRYEDLCPVTKTTIHRGCFPRSFAKFWTATFENKFRGCFWKENRRGEGCSVTLVVSGFHFCSNSYLLSHETIFFLYKFWHSGAFQFGLCYPF